MIQPLSVSVIIESFKGFMQSDLFGAHHASECFVRHQRSLYENLEHGNDRSRSDDQATTTAMIMNRIYVQQINAILCSGSNSVFVCSILCGRDLSNLKRRMSYLQHCSFRTFKIAKLRIYITARHSVTTEI